MKNERRTMKNDEEFPQNRLRKRYGRTSAWIFFTRHIFSPKIAEMHSQGVQNILKQPSSPIYREKERCLPPRGFLRNISKFTPFFVLYGKVMEALWKCFRFDFHPFLSSLSLMLSEICLPKVFGNFTKTLQMSQKPRKPFFNNVEELAAQLLPP